MIDFPWTGLLENLCSISAAAYRLQCWSVYYDSGGDPTVKLQQHSWEDSPITSLVWMGRSVQFFLISPLAGWKEISHVWPALLTWDNSTDTRGWLYIFCHPRLRLHVYFCQIFHFPATSSQNVPILIAIYFAFKRGKLREVEPHLTAAAPELC